MMRLIWVFLLVGLGGCVTTPDVSTAERRAMLENPDHEGNNQQAPEVFKVLFHTTRGDFIVEAHRSWAPNGVDRFYSLVQNRYYEGCCFFRIVPDFLAQWGTHTEPMIERKWSRSDFLDDPDQQKNTRGMISYGLRGKNTRTTHLIINYKDNSEHIDASGAPPIAKVIDGMAVVDQLYAGYGDMRGFGGNAPDSGKIASEGIAYLKREYPKIDYIITTRIIR
jgi:peptidyl-prolyl cis-trans isomerase A (cyclophilin A)